MSTQNEQNASAEPVNIESEHPEPGHPETAHAESVHPDPAYPAAQSASVHPESAPVNQSAFEQTPPTAAPAAAATAAPRKLSTFLKVSIILLAGLSIASISLLFIGDFQGKFERVFSTFIVFAVFVGLTALDTRRGQRNEWYAPVALIANSYILALSLIVIWMTPYSWALGWEIFWKGLLVLAVTRAVVGCAQLLLGMATDKPKPLSVFAMVTSLLATVTGILFTAPVAIEVFNVSIPEMYWKFAVAALLLTALGLSITLLLRWSYGAEDREAARRQRQAAQAMQPQPYQAQGFPVTPVSVAEPVAPASPTVVVTEAPASAPAMQPMPEAATAQPVANLNAEQPLLPWPTFADGSPLPVGPDGQPDFSALNR